MNRSHRGHYADIDSLPSPQRLRYGNEQGGGSEIDRLEASLETPTTKDGDALAAALDHTAEAMELARAAGLRVDEVRAWTNYGMALQSAGLARQADERLAHALDLLKGLDEPRLAGNIWALRSQLGWHLEEAGFQQAAYACEQALLCAEASPARFRDSMACTALCNSAALEILRGNVDSAKSYLVNAAA